MLPLSILGPVVLWTKDVISALGYPGIVMLMGIESACVPLPSEVIMPFSGYLVSTGRFGLHGAAWAGALGCAVGSTLAYWVGAWGGRPFLERWGRYLLIRRHDLDLADRWFARWGLWAVFWSRVMPVVRTFISLPAGISRVRFGPFILLSFVGSLPWCYLLAWVGKLLGENWESLGPWFHRADLVIGLLIVAGLTWFLWRHLRPEERAASS